MLSSLTDRATCVSWRWRKGIGHLLTLLLDPHIAHGWHIDLFLRSKHSLTYRNKSILSLFIWLLKKFTFSAFETRRSFTPRTRKRRGRDYKRGPLLLSDHSDFFLIACLNFVSFSHAKLFLGLFLFWLSWLNRSRRTLRVAAATACLMLHAQIFPGRFSCLRRAGGNESQFSFHHLRLFRNAVSRRRTRKKEKSSCLFVFFFGRTGFAYALTTLHTADPFSSSTWVADLADVFSSLRSF